MTPVRVEVSRVGDRGEPLPLPRYMTDGAAGLDLLADVAEPLTLAPLGRALVPTGLALALPDGYEAQVRPRSGLALRHGIAMPNAPGTIDADYRGELQVILINHGDAPFAIRRGDRIAQLVISRLTDAEFVEKIGPDATDRGAGGFGSTGTESISQWPSPDHS